MLPTLPSVTSEKSACENFLKSCVMNIMCQIWSITFDVHGSVHSRYISKYNQRDATLHNLFLWNAVHVSSGTSAHHQELKNCIYSIGYLTITRCCIYSFWAPDDGRRYRLKHVHYFTEINKLCHVAACWLYLEIWSITFCAKEKWSLISDFRLPVSEICTPLGFYAA
jgi:hypothetical protein